MGAAARVCGQQASSLAWSLNVNSLYMRHGRKPWEAFRQGMAPEKDDGWSSQMNTNRVDVGEQMVGHMMERGPRRQRRLDEFP